MSVIDELTSELARLPGIGRKTALRLTYHLLRQPHSQSRRLAEALVLLTTQAVTPEQLRARLAEAGASVVHCPTSNTFIGSGLFDMGLTHSLRVGLATDTGGGSSFSMLRTMAAAYEVAELRGQALHPAQLWWLATQGSARALRAEHQIGNIAVGQEADLVVVNLASTPAIEQATRRAEDIWQALFPTIMLGDDRAIQAVWALGRLVL